MTTATKKPAAKMAPTKLTNTATQHVAGSRRRTPEQPANEQAQIQFRLPTALRDRLVKEANRRLVSINLLIERAIEQSLDAWEKQKGL